MIIAIDTSVLIGILDTRDVWHSAALQVQGALLPAQLAPVYFDCVLAEAASTLVRRLREQEITFSWIVWKLNYPLRRRPGSSPMSRVSTGISWL
jgi:predicted nucleic acid-binding protein